MIKLCECGCGREVKSKNARFAPGHCLKTLEGRKQLAKSLKEKYDYDVVINSEKKQK